VDPHYDAFMSYSHALDGRLAPVLQAELERFGSPWYRPRVRRVFRDNASLSANPQLWSAIETALGSSRWFVLLASPAAAASEWVDREVQWWLDNRSSDHLLIVLTDGELVFDRTGRVDAKRTTSLPPALVARNNAEPRWVDLRWVRTEVHLDRDNPALRDSVADVAAAVSEMPKDELVGEHVRRARQTTRLVRVVVATLSTLLVVATAAGLVAAAQRNQAREQARVATARLLASTAQGLLGTRLDLAQLLAVQAYRLDPSQQSRAALFSAATASPHLVGFMSADATVTAVDGNRLVAVIGTADGRILRWDLRSGQQRQIGRLDGAVRTVAAVADGTAAVAADSRSATLLPMNGGAALHLPMVPGQRPEWTAISPSGRYAAVVARSPEDGNPTGSLTVHDLRTGEDRQASLDADWDRVGFRDDSVLTLGRIGVGNWERREVATLTPVLAAGVNFGTHNSGNAFARNGEFVGFANVSGEVPIWHTANLAPNQDQPDLQGLEPGTSPEAMTISDDGRRLAIAETGTIYVSDTKATAPNTAVSFTGSPSTNGNGVVFAGDDDHILSASADRVAFWDLRQFGRISRAVNVTMDYGCSACTEPPLVVGPHADGVATQAQFAAVLNVLELSSGVRQRDLQATDPAVSWTPDGSLLMVATDHGGGRTLSRDGARLLADWPTDPFSQRSIATVPIDGGNSVLVVDSAGNRILRDPRTGAVRTATPAPEGLRQLMADQTVEQVAVSHDAANVAVRRSDTVVVADLSDGTTRTLERGRAVASIQFTDDQLFVRRDDGVVEIWTKDGSRLLRTVSADISNVRQVAVDPTGAMMALRRTDGGVVLADAGTGGELGQFPVTAGEDGGHTNLAFSPDGRKLVSVSTLSGLQVWETTDEAWTRSNCRGAGRDLTLAEWRRYAGSLDPGDLRCAPADAGSLTRSTAVTSGHATAGRTSHSSPRPSSPAPAATSRIENGLYYGYLRQVRLPTITYDQVDWFTGAAAKQACRDDKVQPGDSALCNDYYVRNKNPLLRTLDVGTDAKATLSEESPEQSTAIPLPELSTQLSLGRLSNSVFKLTVRGNRLVAINQVFIP
jgi:WD40 repeat protein